MKMRSDADLAQLNEEQLASLYDWIDVNGFTKAQRRAAQPAPEGFGLDLHQNSLVRFHKREQRLRHARELAVLAATQNSGDAPHCPVTALIAGAKAEFAHATYELALSVDRQNYGQLEKALHRIDMADFKRQELEFKREHFVFEKENAARKRLTDEYNVARALLLAAPDYMDILRRTDIDNEDKIWLARDRAFGPSAIAPFPRNDSDRCPTAAPSYPQPCSPPPQNHCPASAVGATSPSSFSSEPSLPSFPSVKNPDPENLSKSPSPSSNNPHSAIANPQTTAPQFHAVPHCTASASPSSPQNLCKSAKSVVDTLSPSFIPPHDLTSAQAELSAVESEIRPLDTLEPENPSTAPDAPTKNTRFHTLTHANEKTEPSNLAPASPTDTQFHAVPHCAASATPSSPQNPCPASAVMCKSPSRHGGDVPSVAEHSPLDHSAPSLSCLPSVKIPASPSSAENPSPASAVMRHSAASAVNPSSPSFIAPHDLISEQSELSAVKASSDSARASQLRTQRPEPSTALPGAAPHSATLGHDNLISTDVSSQSSSPGDPDPARSSAFSRSGAIQTFNPPPGKSASGVLPEPIRTAKESPGSSHSQIPPSANPNRQSVLPQTKTISQWLREARQPELLKNYFIDRIGSIERLDQAIRNETKFTIGHPRVLRELA